MRANGTARWVEAREGDAEAAGRWEEEAPPANPKAIPRRQASTA
jgi:hypothetical protein